MKALRSVFYFIALLVAIINPGKASAGNAAAAELMYQWVHDSTYQVFYMFYRDCSGGSEPDSVSMCYKNTCSTFSATQTLHKVTGLVPPGIYPGGMVPTGCAGVQTTCTLPGSTVPGYWEWWYSAYITLPSRCNYWVFSVATYSRNGSISNLVNPGSQYLYSEATLDNLDAQGNTSPFFYAKPIAYACVNLLISLNFGAYDINNDSLVYTLVSPKTGSGCPAISNTIDFQNASPSYNVKNVNGNPLQCNNTFNLDTLTGMVSFTPANAQTAAIAIRVDEYRNQQKIGSVTRDMQVAAGNCTSGLPAIQLANFSWCYFHPGISNAPDTIISVPGAPVSFGIYANGTPTSNHVYISTNAGNVLPFSTFRYTNVGPGMDSALFGWKASVHDTGDHYITISAIDTNCSSNFGINPTKDRFVVVRILATAYDFSGCYTGTIGGSFDSSDIGVFSIGAYTFGVGGPYLNNAAAVNSHIVQSDTVSLLTDNSYLVSLSDIIRTGNTANAKVSLFIDYNNDLQFEIPHERVWTTLLYPGNDTPKVILTIPASYVMSGVPVHARLILNNNTGLSAASDSACGIYLSGETLDFMVMFQNGVSSVNTMKAQQYCSVYPNPSDGKFILSLSSGKPLCLLEINVKAISGQTILSKSFQNTDKQFSTELDMRGVAKGLYFIETNADGLRQISKIIVQ